MVETILGVGSRINHPAYGDGVIIRLFPVAYEVCFMTFGIKQVGKDYDKWSIIEAVVADEAVTFSEAERSLIKILKTWSDVSELVPMNDKWLRGTMTLTPDDKSLKAVEWPIETFFHKIVMLRDRLRVMEAKINASSRLNDEEKIELQQYITRIYGSLTTFNVLFKHKDHNFVGQKSV